MRNDKTYYSNSIANFLFQEKEQIFGHINSNDISTETNILQRNTWNEEIDILKRELACLDEGYIIFEYIIPRMAKRIDVVLIYKNIIFLLEFKCGKREYSKQDFNQVYDYALDLKNFHKESHDRLIVPILIPTKSENNLYEIIEEHNRIIKPIGCSPKSISDIINKVILLYNKEAELSYEHWLNSPYCPTPTIIEAAVALYNNHNVADITKNDSGTKNLTSTMYTLRDIIENSKKSKSKSICFITGVPGAGKTLVGLNLAIERFDVAAGEHAVFLSGNYPLVTVLQEALARDKVKQEKAKGNKISKEDAKRQASVFIQIVHKYRDEFVNNDRKPSEHIVIFDEAQRAWNKEKIEQFMKTKKGISNFGYSEPEFLISTIDRLDDWGVIICLIGGGQEINTGEAGLSEWFDALHRSFSDWNIYIAPEQDVEYLRSISDLTVHENENLHLKTSVRSFRTPDLALFVKKLLDNDIENAKKLSDKIKKVYPFYITRDLSKAKKWVKDMCKGNTKCGLLASSNAGRLKAEGVFVKNEVDVRNWFLGDKDDVRSGSFLEDVVSEFDIQGLEIDYSILAWDIDLRIENAVWSYHSFSGGKWQNIKHDLKKLYLKNSYRVLLTRARQGQIIYVPKGASKDEDHTREARYYDNIYSYLRSCGIDELI